MCFLLLISRYHSLAPMYYRGAQAAIVVYDIQNQDSFQRAKTWVKELQRQVSESFFFIIAFVEWKRKINFRISFK